MRKTNFVPTIIFAGSLLLQLSTLCFHSRGAAGDVDLSFDPGSGVNGPVTAVVLQPDGKVIIAGAFTMVKGLLRTNIARLNADGTGDATFNPVRAYNPVHVLALQSDGKVLVGGPFLEICDDFSCSYSTAVIRLNANGSLDNSFNPAIAESSDYGPVRTLIEQPDGKVLIGGNFTTVNGTNRNRIARLNANGALDTSFNIGAGPNGAVHFAAAQPDGKVLMGGRFTTFDGTNCGSVARLHANGTLDNSFNSGFGVRNYRDCGGDVCYNVAFPTAAALQPNGKVLVGVSLENWQCDAFDGGCFLSYSYSVTRLNADGSSDPSFVFTNVVNNTALLGLVKSIAVQSDDKIVVGSSAYNTVRIARLNADGSWDNSFNPGTGPSGGVDAVALQPDGKVLIGGGFTAVNGTNRNRIARLNADGSLDGSFFPGRGLDGPVAGLAVQPDGKVIIGRTRLNADGSLDSTYIYVQPTNNPGDPFPADVSFPGYDYIDSIFVACIVVQSDGKRLYGGYFASTYVDNEGSITRWTQHFLMRFNADATRDTNFAQVIGYPAYGLSDIFLPMGLIVQPDGKLLFTPRYPFTRLNANGTPDTNFVAVVNPVSSIRLEPDGRIFITGGFAFVNGTQRGGIARLNANGSLDNSFNPGTGANGNVASYVFQSDGKMLIGGSFTSVNGTNRNRIARLNVNGSLDSSFNPGTGADGSIRAIALQSDGNVLISGDFLTINGVLRPYVARLHGDSPAPSLSVARWNSFVILSWPAIALNFQLHETTNLSLPNSWLPVAQPAVTNGTQISIAVPVATSYQFFRLISP